MSAEDSFVGLQIPNVSDIQQIVTQSTESAKILLAEKLGIPPYYDSKDPQKAPFINYIYDNIIFATEVGMPWNHIGLIVKFAHVFLKGILVENHSLPDAIKDFQKKSDILSALNERHQKQYTDFLYDTVLTHYNLYKYVFSHLRENVNPKVEKKVEVPPTPLPLAHGVSVEVWEYKKKVEEIEIREADALKKLKEEQSRSNDQIICTKTMADLDEMETPYSKMSLQEMIKDVLKCYTETKKKDLQDKADEIVQDLGFKLEKTSLARPITMGEPPRYKPRPVNDLRQNKNENKSNKGSAKSSRSARSKSRSSSSKSKK